MYLQIPQSYYALNLFLIYSKNRSFGSKNLNLRQHLGSVIADTMKFAFLFFEFYVPYTVGFWILFGGEKHGKVMGDDGRKNWEKLNDLMFSVWSVSIYFIFYHSRT